MSSPTPPWPLPELLRVRRAIVVVDVVESVRLMEEDEAGFIDCWRRLVHGVRGEVLPKHGGRLVKSLGDGMLLEFEDVPRGVAAALETLERCAQASALPASGARLCVRVGMNVADVVHDDLDIYGSGVNVAARLAGLANPGELVVSEEVRHELVDDLDARIEDLGECFVKHLPHTLRAYRVGAPATDGAQHRLCSAQDLRPTIAVLPLRTAAGTAGEAALGEVLADRIIASLSRSPLLCVLSRLTTSVMARRRNATTVAHERGGADYVLSGSIAADGTSRWRVAWALIDAGSQRVAWAGECSARAEELLDEHSRPLLDAMSAIGEALLQEQTRWAAARGLPSLPSYTLLMAAIGNMHRVSGKEAFDRAATMLEHLGERHPRHPAAFAWLGKWHVLRVVQGWAVDAQAEGRAALAAVRRALNLDPNDALALTIEGQTRGFLLQDLDGARRRHDEALASNPNEPLVWLHKANVHAWLGEGEPALQCAQRAADLSPLDPLRFYFDSLACAAALTAGKPELAVTLGERSMRANCLHASTLRLLAIAQVLSGDGAAARATAQSMLQLVPDYRVGRFVERYPGRGRPHAEVWAKALTEAGVPA
jgi:class 3 adenylate cyclase/tetratricopeptide (TPR) repeat protein